VSGPAVNIFVINTLLRRPPLDAALFWPAIADLVQRIVAMHRPGVDLWSIHEVRCCPVRSGRPGG
jgi:hypothetical protein